MAIHLDPVPTYCAAVRQEPGPNIIHEAGKVSASGPRPAGLEISIELRFSSSRLKLMQTLRTAQQFNFLLASLTDYLYLYF